MKIAILTQPLGYNYGGIMQAWALQQVLIKMGHKPVTIDRRQDSSMAKKTAFIITGKLKRWLGRGIVEFDKYFDQSFLGNYHLNSFVEENIKSSGPIFSKESLVREFEGQKYDAVIVGSDQTWRPAYSPSIYNYFLDFLPENQIKKIAYSSSFGVDNWEFDVEQTIKCALLAGKFDAISVRESSGVDLCRKHLGVDAVNTLDPTLLMSKDDYIRLIKNKETLSTGGRVCRYFLDESPEKDYLATEVAKKLRMKLYNNRTKNKSKGGESEFNSGRMLTVPEWINGFAISDFVITDSYHGMIFSIIFNKPFLVIENEHRGRARFHSVLTQLGINGRTCSVNIKNPNILHSPPLDDCVQRKLKSLREESIKYLAEALK